jgi:excisionase family DNA binding protein
MYTKAEQAEQDERGYYDLAVAVTGLKRGTLQAKVSRGQIPHYRLGKRLVVFSRQELTQWMHERRVGAQHEPLSGETMRSDGFGLDGTGRR